MNENFKVGQTYPKDGITMRVIAVENNKTLLEQSRYGELIQYIVTSNLYLYEGELHWRGSGAYFPCMYPPPICDAPFVALRKAIEYMREGTETVEAKARYYFQVYYREQDSRIQDTVQFDIRNPIAEDDFVEAMRNVTAQFSGEAYEDADSLETTDCMLNRIADAVGGSWKYTDVLGVVDVDGCQRGFYRA